MALLFPPVNDLTALSNSSGMLRQDSEVDDQTTIRLVGLPTHAFSVADGLASKFSLWSFLTINEFMTQAGMSKYSPVSEPEEPVLGYPRISPKNDCGMCWCAPPLPASWWWYWWLLRPPPSPPPPPTWYTW